MAQADSAICEGCAGRGWLHFNDDEVQRCDDCQKFGGDLEAAIAFLEDPDCGYWLSAITVKPKPINYEI